MQIAKKYWVNKMHALTKLAVSLVLGVATYFLIDISALTRLVLSWDIFCLCLLSLTWFTLFTTDSHHIRLQAQMQDDSRVLVFILTLLSAGLSMYSVVHMIVTGTAKTLYQTLNLYSGLSCMILSWILVHTIFTIQYAHLYYAVDTNHHAPHAGGLEFPGETVKPNFIDFAYFSFTIGMTFQVSDVEISGYKIRRIALLQALFSFAFNATIIALSVNVISGLVAN